MIHEGLESWWGIAEPEKDDCGFIKTKGGDEHSFPLMLLLNVNVVVTPSYIKLGEESRVFHVID